MYVRDERAEMPCTCAACMAVLARDDSSYTNLCMLIYFIYYDKLHAPLDTDEADDAGYTGSWSPTRPWMTPTRPPLHQHHRMQGEMKRRLKTTTTVA
ncbi:hypothetical protein U9M48_028714 [Paspalum notatum var. saurae]|uniref:Uncharacterized protein n=1 Tax=Paspalum notatum var. saurae TaxID=547442 RepID=A0AAQ3TZ42_PASNO